MKSSVMSSARSCRSMFWELFHVVNLGNYLAHSLCDFPTAGVAHGHHDSQSVQVFRQLLQFGNLLLHAVGQALAVAHHAELHVVVGEEFHLIEAEHEPHDGLNLVGGTVPVLGGEGVERQVLHAQPGAFGGDFLYRVESGLVAEGAVQSTVCSPAPVAVHDDGNVLRDALHV